MRTPFYVAGYLKFQETRAYDIEIVISERVLCTQSNFIFFFFFQAICMLVSWIDTIA